MRQIISVSRDGQDALIDKLKSNSSTDSQRVLRLLLLPDLTQVENHPIKLMKDLILDMPRYQDFDIITIPEIVSTQIMFDSYHFPKDHPARSPCDTYYVDQSHVLRPHTSIMRRYYLEHPGIREKLEKEGKVGVISYGKVYRKDEIDRTHSNVFHNIDGIYICKKKKEIIGRNTLESILNELIQSIYKNTYKRRIIDDYNPYTDPTLEVEIPYQGKELELLGSGVLRPELLQLLNLDPQVYNARAWGPGLERLIMPMMHIPDIRIFWSDNKRITDQWGNLDHIYEEVSKYPSTYRDISFIVTKSTALNNYYTLIRDIAGDIVEQVELLETYESDSKFGSDYISYSFRIIYRSHDKTLTNDEINNIQNQIRLETQSQLDAQLR